MDRICVVCSKTFPSGGSYKLCSDACKKVRKNHYTKKQLTPKAERACAECGKKMLTGHPQKTYCSRSCKDATRWRLRRNGAPPRRKGPAMTKSEESRAYRQRNIDRVRERDRNRKKRTTPPAEGEAVARALRAEKARARIDMWKLRKAQKKSAKGIRIPRDTTEMYRDRYRNDAIFRQAEIQRSKSNKLKRKNGITTQVNANQVRALYAERSTCLYCGCQLDERSKVLDHMDPLSKGGAHCASNLVVVCGKCNTRKSAKPFVQWVAKCPIERQPLIVRVYEDKRGAPIDQAGFDLRIINH